MLALDQHLVSRPGRVYAVAGPGVAEWAYWDERR